MPHLLKCSVFVEIFGLTEMLGLAAALAVHGDSLIRAARRSKRGPNHELRPLIRHLSSFAVQKL